MKKKKTKKLISHKNWLTKQTELVRFKIVSFVTKQREHPIPLQKENKSLQQHKNYNNNKAIMFNFHKPRVYRSTDGCCICRAKSSSSRFTASRKYEKESMQCFNLHEPRNGEICNACVLLVKRYKRLPVGSKRHWGHVSVNTKRKRHLQPKLILPLFLSLCLS